MMVSTHSQYLCPDYLSPMPNSTDSGKSPLALLAQTCNSIGADPPNKSKSILPANDKSTTPPRKESMDIHSKLPSSSHVTSTVKNNNTPAKISSATKSTSSRSSTKDTHYSHGEPAVSPNSTMDENANKAASPAIGTKDESTVKAESRPTSQPTNIASTSSMLIPPSMPSVSRCFPSLPPGYPLYSNVGLPPAFAGLYPHGLPPTGYPSFGSLPGATFASRPCVDPLCTACPPRPAANTSNCMFGCTQCSHTPSDLSMWLQYNSLLHGMPHLPASLPVPPSAVVSMADSSAGPIKTSGSNGGGHMCSWLVKGTNQPCFKKFATAEELVAHLKVHTQEDQNKMPSTTATSGGRLSPRSLYLMSTSMPLRYNPYPKMSPSVSGPSFPPMLNPLASAYSLSALYAGQWLPGSLPHP